MLGDKWGMPKGPSSAIEEVEVEPCCGDTTAVAGVEVEVCWTMHFVTEAHSQTCASLQGDWKHEDIVSP